jgi:hypothetical protein
MTQEPPTMRHVPRDRTWTRTTALDQASLTPSTGFPSADREILRRDTQDWNCSLHYRQWFKESSNALQYRKMSRNTRSAIERVLKPHGCGKDGVEVNVSMPRKFPSGTTHLEEGAWTHRRTIQRTSPTVNGNGFCPCCRPPRADRASRVGPHGTCASS